MEPHEKLAASLVALVSLAAEKGMGADVELLAFDLSGDPVKITATLEGGKTFTGEVTGDELAAELDMDMDADEAPAEKPADEAKAA